ncbi:MAG TPA: nucleotidyltransferase domain-containing protein [Phycisphaerales bacterium]|nr:nucleotidyltransferase domain-containing protein [Phycisphaerales bacterium]
MSLYTVTRMTHPTDTASGFDGLCHQWQQHWPAIASARQKAPQIRQQIHDAITAAATDLIPPDAALVVFGSLSRNEWTSGSDVDWTLLLDTGANPQHYRVTQRIGQILSDLKLAEPGNTGTFGNMTFSHDLIHQIGGQEDTNINQTRRLLMILESTAIVGSDVHQRVLGQILQRYVHDGLPMAMSHEPMPLEVPRFLLNDIVRYWRTMTVDYAKKAWDSPNHKWAVRKSKLRLSRKLMFTSGLLMCFSCELSHPDSNPALFDHEPAESRLVNQLLKQVALSPMDRLCNALLQLSHPQTAAILLGAYDRFLAVLNDPEARKILTQLTPQSATNNDLFTEIQQLGEAFNAGLETLFFDDHPALAQCIRRYGIF